MLLNEYINQYISQYNRKQSNKLEEFCRLEGLDSLYIRSIVKNDLRQKRLRKKLKSSGHSCERQRNLKETTDYS